MMEDLWLQHQLIEYLSMKRLLNTISSYDQLQQFFEDLENYMDAKIDNMVRFHKSPFYIWNLDLLWVISYWLKKIS